MTTSEHPVAVALREAAAGRFPPVDGRVEIVPPDAAGTHAVVEFTGHSYVLTDLAADDAAFAGIGGYGGATDPRRLVRLAGPTGSIGSLDVVMVRRGGDGRVEPLTELAGRDDHPRVVRSQHHRRDVRVFGDDRGVVTIGRGLVDRTELSLELTGAASASGVGRALVTAALERVSHEEWVFVQVAPGNAASVRMFLACGFVPVGSEVLIEPDRA